MNKVEPGMEAMLETFIHETETMLEQLDEILLDSERARSLSDENINNIFRITHTVKGSAAMMNFDVISTLAHAVEDVFYVLRGDPAKLSLVFETLFDLVLSTSDFLKSELEKLQLHDDYLEGNASDMISKLHQQAAILKGNDGASDGASNKADYDSSSQEGLEGEDLYKIRVFFTDDCQMENMRVFMLLSQLQHCCDELDSVPSHPENDSALSEEIAKNGFLIICRPTGLIDEVLKTIEGSMNIKSYEIIEDVSDVIDETIDIKVSSLSPEGAPAGAQGSITGKPPVAVKGAAAKQSLISVNQSKLDHLMDLVGELVTAESMVVRNPDLKGLKLDNFTKSIRDLRKLTSELQDIVMSIRMVPLHSTFHKMDRIVRDMCKKLDKKVELFTEGGETEVDKTINDSIVDPFMHMIRNSMDHGIEAADIRMQLGKPEVARITLSARNVGGEIHINISDDGKGLDSEKLLAKARQKGLLTKPENEYTDKEAFALIMLPGFSTNSEVTEFSGRGVGLDVVCKNVEQVGGAISINSVAGQGTTFTIKIPLTLAIVDGMNIAVGDTVFTLPITSIKQSFKIADPKQIIHNTNGTEMIMVRGDCYPIYRLHQVFSIPTAVEEITEGIMIHVESGSANACIFTDALLGEYQVVVKPFPTFFNKYNLKDSGLSGCSILGDGSISLIIDTNSLLNK